MLDQVRQLRAVRTCGSIDNDEVGITRQFSEAVFESSDASDFCAVLRAPLEPVQAGALRVEVGDDVTSQGAAVELRQRVPGRVPR